MFNISDVLIIGVGFLMVHVSIYSIVDRICKCVETKYYQNAFISRFDSGLADRIEDIECEKR